MPVVTRRELLEAGVHFGHQTRRWNPKMKRFIFGERSGIYIIDLEKSLVGIERAYDFLLDVGRRGGSVLFVGTKKQAQEVVAEQAGRVGMPYVNTRWLGGMLTNFQTIYRRLQRLKALREMERSGMFEYLPKKEVIKLRHEKEKLERNLSGLQDMERLPQAIFVIDTKKEHIAVTEANRLHIPVVAIVDTNCDPDVIDYVIPGNDDAIRSANLMCRVIGDAVNEGRELGRRRNARPGTRSEDPAPAAVVTAPVRPQRTPEQEKEFQERQTAAKAAAAAKQREIEERAKVKAKPVIPPPPGAEAPAADAPKDDAPKDDAEAAAPAAETADAAVETEGA